MEKYEFLNYNTNFIEQKFEKYLEFHLLCILISFRVLRTTEICLKYFLGAFFNLFCSFQMFFSDFSVEFKKIDYFFEKKCVLCYSLKLVYMQMLVNSRFSWFQLKIIKKCLKWTNNVENGPKKVFQPAFGCTQHSFLSMFQKGHICESNKRYGKCSLNTRSRDFATQEVEIFLAQELEIEEVQVWSTGNVLNPVIPNYRFGEHKCSLSFYPVLHEKRKYRVKSWIIPF